MTSPTLIRSIRSQLGPWQIAWRSSARGAGRRRIGRVRSGDPHTPGEHRGLQADLQPMAGLPRPDGALNESEGPGDRATPHGWRHGVARTSSEARAHQPATETGNLGAILRLLVPGRDWSFVIRPGNRSLKRAIRAGLNPSSCATSPT